MSSLTIDTTLARRPPPGKLQVTPELSAAEYLDRLKAMRGRVWASTDYDFDDVTTRIYVAPKGYYTVDPHLVYDNGRWHLFYVTGRMAIYGEFIERLNRGDFKGAAEMPGEEGEGHAVGNDLFNLKYHSTILDKPQGEFSFGLQGDSAIVRHAGRWLNLYSARGHLGGCLCRAYSDDLYTWTLDPDNPVLFPPAWMVHPGKFGGVQIVPYQDRYLIYTIGAAMTGGSASGLLSTRDFHTFTDHGPVLIIPKQMRGTNYLEFPTVVQRHGMWHMFYNVGEGVWHAISPRPDSFMGLPIDPGMTWRDANQAQPMSYFLGRFHAQRVFEDPATGKWYLITTRKEQQRYLNRKAGVNTPRGSVADERPLEDGFFLSAITWEGDFPVLRRPTKAG